MKLYRVMRMDPADGGPLIGTQRNMLGVRPLNPANTDPKRKFDVDAVNGTDPVLPGTRKGLSVSVAADGLFVARNEAIWAIEDVDLLPDLIPVPDRPPHHILEPGRPMTLDDYQAVLAASRMRWIKVS